MKIRRKYEQFRNSKNYNLLLFICLELFLGGQETKLNKTKKNLCFFFLRFCLIFFFKEGFSYFS